MFCVWCRKESAAEAGGMSHGRARACNAICLMLFMCMCVARRDSEGRSPDQPEQRPELRPQCELVGHHEGWISQHHHLWQRAWEWVMSHDMWSQSPGTCYCCQPLVTNCVSVLEPCHEACGDVPCWGPGRDKCQISEWLQHFNSWCGERIPNVYSAEEINM